MVSKRSFILTLVCIFEIWIKILLSKGLYVMDSYIPSKRQLSRRSYSADCSVLSSDRQLEEMDDSESGLSFFDSLSSYPLMADRLTRMMSCDPAVAVGRSVFPAGELKSSWVLNAVPPHFYFSIFPAANMQPKGRMSRALTMYDMRFNYVITSATANGFQAAVVVFHFVWDNFGRYGTLQPLWTDVFQGQSPVAQLLYDPQGRFELLHTETVELTCVIGTNYTYNRTNPKRGEVSLDMRGRRSFWPAVWNEDSDSIPQNGVLLVYCTSFLAGVGFLGAYPNVNCTSSCRFYPS